ncbi:hypothetical protein [Kutzneria sp. NPDC052558]|uniref:hypothetical protein n=1 Tax=Kutzneria sp. NPDC052558 TaxID=3364121 RepID=UPI0037C8E287
MLRRYRYYVVVTDRLTRDNPFAVVRQWDSGEEFFTHHLRWERTDLLSRIAGGQLPARAEPITKQEAKRHVAMYTERFQHTPAAVEPPPGWRYYVIVSDTQPRDDPFALVRARGRHEEEFFSPRLVWERNDILERISRGSMDRDEVPITEQEAEHYQELLTRRFRRQQAD